MSAIPQQMVSQALPLGVTSMKDLTSEKIKLKPVNQAQRYSKAGINKISFRLPAYSNSFMDVSKSFLTYKLGYTTGLTSSSISATETCVPLNGANFITRMVVKSSAGLVIDDISDYEILNQMKSKMLQSTDVSNGLEGRTAESMETGVFSGAHSFARKFHTTGTEYKHSFCAGLLSKSTEKYLQVGAMDSGSGSALDIDLYLADDAAVIRQLHANVTNPKYFVEDVVLHLENLRADESLYTKFNEIALSQDQELIIPFVTNRCHKSFMQNTGNNIVRIHESCTDLRKIWSVYVVNADQAINNAKAFQFVGGALVPATQVMKFNARVGSKFIHNEAVTGAVETITHLKNALGLHDKALYCDQFNSTGNVLNSDKSALVQVIDFGYSSGEKFLDGIASNTPIELYIEMGPSYTPSTVTMFSFTEMSYNLSIKNGQVRYVETRPGASTVY